VLRGARIGNFRLTGSRHANSMRRNISVEEFERLLNTICIFPDLARWALLMIPALFFHRALHVQMLLSTAARHSWTSRTDSWQWSMQVSFSQNAWPIGLRFQVFLLSAYSPLFPRLRSLLAAQTFLSVTSSPLNWQPDHAVAWRFSLFDELSSCLDLWL
jgi:hypothetical protein